MKKIDRSCLIGRRFGMLLVTSRSPNIRHGTHVLYICRCDCGTDKELAAKYLREGFSTHCGCSPKQEQHGMSYSAEYRAYKHMIDRCYRETDSAYEYYGARGIRVCLRWRNSFADFLADMGHRPSNKHSINRKDNDGNYCPDNCEWATKIVQARNTTASRWITHQGEKLTLAEWAERAGISSTLLHYRIGKLGWLFAEAISTPARRCQRS